MYAETCLKDFDCFYQEAWTAWSPFISEAEIDLRFFLGDQWAGETKTDLHRQGRHTFVFNKIKRIINMITGYQRKHRLSSIVTPVESSDQATSDQLSQLLLYVMQYGDGYQIISDCFGGALKTGLNLMSLWIDYTDDIIDGDIRFTRESYSNFMLDPYFTRLDFSDCNYILRRKYLSLDQTISIIPAYRKELEDMCSYGWARDDKFTWMPYQRTYNGQPMMAYNEVWKKSWKPSDVLVDTETGEYLDWSNGDEERFQELKFQYPQLEIVKRQRPIVTRQIIVNDQYIEETENPDGLNEYPFVPFVAQFEPESDDWSRKIQSVVRPLKDPQIETNMRRSQMTDIIDTNINSGWVATEGSVVNPRSLFQSATGKVIWRKKDAPPGSLERIQPARLDPSMFQLQELFERDMLEISGVNDAAFGQADTQESGVLAMLRQGAALINLQDLFDNLRFSQKMISQKALKLIQNWTPAKVKKVLREEPTQEFYNKNFTKYDCVVQEGILTDTQRQMFFRQLVDLKNLGEPIPPLMLTKAAPLQGKTELIKEMEQFQQQQQQAQQQQSELQAQVLDSQSQYTKARSINEVASAKERFTRSVANLGLENERTSQSIENRADASLARAKAIKELEEMTDERVMRLFSFMQLMENSNRQQENAIKQDDIVLASQAEEPQQPLPEQAILDSALTQIQGGQYG